MAKNNKADMSCARVKKYTASDVSKAERHNERKNETYENMNVIEERIPYNVHFKKPFAPTYMEQLKQMETDGMVSLRGLRKDATLFNEIVIDVNTMYFERNGGYEYAKQFYEEAFHFIEEKFGADNVISAVMHADEINVAATEELGKEVYHYHLHAMVLPVVEKEILWSKRCKDEKLRGTVKEVVHQISHSKKWKSIVGTRIVRECIKQGNDYIDPFGEGDVEKYIVDNKSMIGDKKTRIILSSGTYPGLSEALFKYVAEIHKGAEVSIKEYFYGNSYFSHGATQDVISSMINNKSKSMSFFYKDEIIPCKMRIGESICIDEKVGTMYLYPIISKDFRRVCKETGVKEGCFFNTFSDLSSMASFFEIGSKIYHSNSMDTFGYTEQLEKMYRNKSTENEKTIFWFGIELVNGNDVEKKLMSFEYACNWNSLSGYVCALVAEWCLNDEISKGKAYNLDEIEGIQKFIESLPGEIKQNIVKL